MQEKMNQQSMDDEASKVMQFKVSMEKESKKVAILSNKRYQKLVFIEDKSDQVQQLLQEKSRLVKKRKETHEAIKAVQARIEKIEANTDWTNKGFDANSEGVKIQMEKTWWFLRELG